MPNPTPEKIKILYLYDGWNFLVLNSELISLKGFSIESADGKVVKEENIRKKIEAYQPDVIIYNTKSVQLDQPVIRKLFNEYRNKQEKKHHPFICMVHCDKVDELIKKFSPHAKSEYFIILPKDIDTHSTLLVNFFDKLGEQKLMLSVNAGLLKSEVDMFQLALPQNNKIEKVEISDRQSYSSSVDSSRASGSLQKGDNQTDLRSSRSSSASSSDRAPITYVDEVTHQKIAEKSCICVIS